MYRQGRPLTVFAPSARLPVPVTWYVPRVCEHTGVLASRPLSAQAVSEFDPSAFRAAMCNLLQTALRRTQSDASLLGRLYTPRGAISSHRLVSLDDNVTFRWRDSADKNKKQILTLHVEEFLRRFSTAGWLRSHPALRLPGQPPPWRTRSVVPSSAFRSVSSYASDIAIYTTTPVSTVYDMGSVSGR
jgi:hypothetical protein